MQANEAIQEELRSLNSSLAAIPAVNIFKVPDGYFESFSITLLRKLESAIEETPSGPVVPGGYFEGLPGEIMRKIRSSESGELEVDGIWNSLTKQNVFKVPGGYFDELAVQVVNKVRSAPAPVIKMSPRFQVYKYALAACLTALLGLSLSGILNGNGDTKERMATTTVLTKETPGTIISDSFEKGLESIPEEELLNYLSKNGEDINAALVASIPEETTLPSASDYFVDERALDKFLTDLNLVQTGNN